MYNKHVLVYIINLRNRPDRRSHILREFYGREEFGINLIDACEHRIGSIGLWNSIKYILQNLEKDNSDFIILCEDNHQFTHEYSKEYLLSCIKEAKKGC